jgi:dipeptidyl aminopeptidase/acylaminoacyl peptidase
VYPGHVINLTQGAAMKRTFLLFLTLVISVAAFAQPLSPTDLFGLKYATSAVLSPDSRWVAYTVSTQRGPNDPPGPSWSEIYVVSVSGGEPRGIVTGKVSASAVRWRPDGKALSYLMAPEKKPGRQVWVKLLDGGEATMITNAVTGVSAYEWHPTGKQIGYLSMESATKREESLREKGYGFIFYEEDLKNTNLYLLDVPAGGAPGEPKQLTSGFHLWSFDFSPTGTFVIFGASTKNLVDHSYAFHNLYHLDLASSTVTELNKREGKQGNYAVSPDGRFLAYAAAFDQKDHAVSQAYVLELPNGEPKNLTPEKFKGHVNWVGWKDNNTVVYRAGEGVHMTLSSVSKDGGNRTVLLHSKDAGAIFSPPSFSADFKTLVFTGSTPVVPEDVYVWTGKGAAKRIVELNPVLKQRQLGEQQVVTYKARDGQPIEGLLILPVGYQKGTSYPLLMFVHGGPEAHHSNNWLTTYSTPGQVMAGKGYASFYVNYRASTGYGLEFAMAGYGDPAGVEFDDLADAIDHLVSVGIADKERVGMAGGSYGGYASAWFATYYTRYIKAACVFVGISNVVSKRGTTDIPYEELFVHSGKPLEEMWDLMLKRSPIYYAKQSRTATLILGGAADPRVHPEQSLQLYRTMKMNDHPAVRLVQYPGEGHGNARQPGRIDAFHRIAEWMDWYVKDKRPLDGPMPPLDISGKYGVE